MVGVTHQKHLDKVTGALFKFRLRDTIIVTIPKRFVTGYESWRCYTPIHPPVLCTLSALLRLVHTTVVDSWWILKEFQLSSLFRVWPLVIRG